MDRNDHAKIILLATFRFSCNFLEMALVGPFLVKETCKVKIQFLRRKEWSFLWLQIFQKKKREEKQMSVLTPVMNKPKLLWFYHWSEVR